MQRDIGNEVIVAILAVAVLAFALTFGIILSLSNTSPDATQQAVVTTESVVQGEGETEVADAPTSTPSLTRTPRPTAAATVTATETEVPPETDTPRPSRTPQPTATDEPTASATVTDTSTPTRTRTPRPTATTEVTETPSRTPTATQTHTLTPTPSDTYTPSATYTRTATPTHTSSPTTTPTRRPTSTATPSDTPTITNTPTITPTPTQTLTETPTPRIVPTVTPLRQIVASATPPRLASNVCIAPFGWIVYTVRPGDNLSSIARSTGTTLSELRDANCLSDLNRLVAGTQLYVPGPEAASGRDNNAPDPQGCTSPNTFITSPLPGERVRRVFFMTGTALSDNFSHFRIEIRADDDRDYELHSESPLAVVDDVLAVVDTTRYEPGLYWLRLSVIDEDDRVRTPTCAIPVIFESP